MLTETDYTRYAQLYMDMVYRVAFGYVKSRADADDVDRRDVRAFGFGGKRRGRAAARQQHA